MSKIHCQLDPASQQPPVQGAAPASKGSSSQNNVDPLLLAFYYLLQASNLSSDSALIHAKQINQNALSQEKLNARLGELQNYSVPTLQKNHHTTHISHWTWKFWKHGFHYHITKTWTTVANQGAVDQSQAKNQEISAQRQMLTDQMTLLQQTAQVSEANVNSIGNEAMQSIQEGTNLLQILQSLTYQALLRQAPQG